MVTELLFEVKVWRRDFVEFTVIRHQGAINMILASFLRSSQIYVGEQRDSTHEKHG